MPSKKPSLKPLGWGEIVPTAGGHELENARLLPCTLLDIDPTQSRQRFDQAALDELAESISTQGVLEPLLVRQVGERFTIIAGERRFRAAVQAGLLDVPVIVFDVDDTQAALMMAAENLQREDLDLEDEARQFARLMELTGYSQRKLAEFLGKTQNYVSRRLRILNEHPEWFAAIREGHLTQREALERLADGSEPARPVVINGQIYPAGSGLDQAGPQGLATTAGGEVNHSGSLSTPDSSMNHGGSPRTPRGAMPDPTRWPDIVRTYRALGKIEPAAVPLEAIDGLASQLQELETLAATTRRALLARLEQST